MWPNPLAYRRGHRPVLAGGQVGHVDLQAGPGVMDPEPDDISGAHEQVLVQVRVHRGQVRAGERPGEQRVRRGLRPPALGDVRPVDRLGTAEDVVVAGGGVRDAGVLVRHETVDGHRRAVLRLRAAESLELRNVSGAVELELHVRVAGVLPDVVRRLGIGSHQVVGVRVGLALVGELRRGLRVAERQAEPERGPQLEIPGRPAGPGRVGLLLRVLRQPDRVGHVIARPGAAGLEEDRRLVVPDVPAAGRARRVHAERVVTLAQGILEVMPRASLACPGRRGPGCCALGPAGVGPYRRGPGGLGL